MTFSLLQYVFLYNVIKFFLVFLFFCCPESQLYYVGSMVVVHRLWRAQAHSSLACGILVP